MQDLINARLERLRAIAQGFEPNPLPETELENIFWQDLDESLAQELEEERDLIDDVWAQTNLR